MDEHLNKLRRYLSGKDIITIADHCGVSAATVRRVLRGAGRNDKVLEEALEIAERNKEKEIAIKEKIKKL